MLVTLICIINMEYSNIEISKLVANIPADLKDFLASESNKRDMSISSYVTEIVSDVRDGIEKRKTLEMFDSFTDKKLDSGKGSIQLVRDLRAENLK